MSTVDRAYWRAPVLGEARVLDLPSGRVAYHDVGSGPPILFVHGLMVNANIWRKVVERLAPDFRCIVLDLPLGSHAVPLPQGAGNGPRAVADMIVEALETLDLDGVALVGSDTGGAICQMVVTSQPERVGRLVLTSCDYRDNFPPKLFSYFKPIAAVPGLLWAVLQPMRLRLLRRWPIAFGWVTKRPMERTAEDSYLLPAMEDAAVRRDVRAFIRGYDRADTNDAADRLSSFLEPVLVAWSAEDRVFPLEDGRLVAAHLPNSRLAFVEDAYTFSMEDNPGRVAELISGFVRQPSRADSYEPARLAARTA